MVISGQLHLQELQGTGGGLEGKKKFLCKIFWLTIRSQVCGKSLFWHCRVQTTSFLSVAKHNLALGLQNAFNVGPANFANSLSPSSIVKKVGAGSRNSHGT